MINKIFFVLLFFLTVFFNAEKIFSEQINNSDNNTESVSTSGLSGKFSINLTDRVERVFSYRLSDGTLRFTNSFNDIPREYAGAIESVSEFPVMCLEYMFLDGKLVMTLDDGGRKVAMAGVLFKSDASRTRAEEYLNKNMADRKLRVRYNPQEESGLYLNGLFYLREGNFINLEMVNKGIGEVDPKTVPSHLLSTFMPHKKD